MAAQTGTGLPKNTAAAISVLLGPTIIAPVVILFLEKDSFVRFTAMQSLVVFVLLYVLGQVLAFSIIFLPFVGLLWIAGVLVWLFLTYKAWQGEEIELPFVGKIAKQLLTKV